MITSVETKSRAFRDLVPASYFGFNRWETFLHRLWCLIYCGRDKTFASTVQKELRDNPGPLSDWKRAYLLGVIHGHLISRAISPNMYSMLQCEIQDKKDWAEHKVE